MCQRGNEVTVKVPDNIELRYNSPSRSKRTTVCIDRCLVDEIKKLWSLGVKTTACCCGHGNCRLASILVKDESIPRMLALGYEHWENPMDKERKDGFKPKTI